MPAILGERSKRLKFNRITPEKADELSRFRRCAAGLCLGARRSWTKVEVDLELFRPGLDGYPSRGMYWIVIRGEQAVRGAISAVFRISKARHPSANLFPADSAGEFDGAVLGKYCATDEWGGDLSNGLFQLGKLSEQLHGLRGPECGLLTLLRCYEEGDRIRILELLEGASSSASSFCFSTHIITGPANGQPILCIGHSTGFGESNDGHMNGVFIFPRMPIETLGH